MDSSEVTKDTGLGNKKEQSKGSFKGEGRKASKARNVKSDTKESKTRLDDEPVELVEDEDEDDLEDDKKKSKKKSKSSDDVKSSGKSKISRKKVKSVQVEKKSKSKPKGEVKKPVGKLVRVGRVPPKSKGSGGSDAVSIDWETDDGEFEATMDERQLMISEFEAQISQLQRENANLINEIAHMKPDLDKKTELIDVYDKRLKDFRDDFERHKLRSLKENRQKMKFASEKIILNLLEVTDNMDRAIDKSKPGDKAESIIEAVAQIRKQMLKILEKDGLKPIEALETPFNPKFHEAIQQEKNDSFPDNTVIEENSKGYIYKEKVIRPTKAKVSQSDVNPAVKIEKPEPDKDEKKKEGKRKKDEKEGKKKEEKKDKDGKEKEPVSVKTEKVTPKSKVAKKKVKPVKHKAKHVKKKK